MCLAPPSDTGGSQITAHVLEADDGKGMALDFAMMMRGFTVKYLINDSLSLLPPL